ncbi:hypothetical protein [Propionivibrio sp.]|uniref:hypothetical protein n=1 Tax=Propionivibrio sp. TaxID=2212460 RepID=UPI0026358789|nr:hypothetical protein [Propionivibrio sp.]
MKNLTAKAQRREGPQRKTGESALVIAGSSKFVIEKVFFAPSRLCGEIAAFHNS